MKKAYLIINEQHSLLPAQKIEISNLFQEVEFVKVPSSGWTLEQIQENIELLETNLTNKDAVVFVSPIPAMMKYLSQTSILWFTFHNDNREKKELPNGKVISVVAKEGWVLV